MSTLPESWVKHVESLVIHSLDPSMWGAIPSFPWENFSKQLATSLNIQDFKISAATSEWKKGELILCGLGQNPLQLAIELSPLKESLSLVFPSEDFGKLSSWIIHPEAKNEGFSDPYLQKGFFRYLCLEAIAIFAPMQLYRGLMPKLIEKPMTNEEAYCIDIAIEHGGETVWGRIICPVSFQKNFKDHFSKDWHFSLPSNRYQSIFLDLSIVAGQTQLSQESWGKIAKGDFVILDHCSYSPNLKKGTFQLQFNHIPFFQVKLKEESFKILDYAYCFEENTIMDECFEQPISEETNNNFTEKEPPVPQDQMLSPQKIPISLSIEVAKLRMNLDKFLKMRPGHVIKLGVQPVKSVSLLANGACVGKGELIQVGDVIGVHITTLSE